MYLKILPYVLALVFAITTYIEYDKEPRVVTNTKTQVVDHTHTVIVTVRDPNGETKTTETIDDNKDTKTEATSSATPPKAMTNVSLSYGNDFRYTFPTPIYGVHITRDLIGPFTVGAYYLTNKTTGVTLGYSF